MKSYITKTVLLSLFFTAGLFAQTRSVSGRVYDARTGEPLSYANVRVDGMMIGTSANLEGKFELRLPEGNLKLIASFIGYVSDTVEIPQRHSVDWADFRLQIYDITLPEVTVLPTEDPAIAIIRKGIEYKHKRNSELKAYKYEAYTKGMFKTKQDVKGSSNSIQAIAEKADSTPLMITAILENTSEGYYKDGKRKEFILARKQTANLPASINFLSGGLLTQQTFYENDLTIFDQPIPSPISDNALDYYYFALQDTLIYEGKPVFKIFFMPQDNADPALIGNVFIADSSFALVKVETELNKKARLGGLLDTVKVFQQFLLYANKYSMPVDYRIFANGNPYGLLKFSAEFGTILYDYEINQNISEETFSKAIITVKPDADKKDSVYWENVVSIPGTADEIKAYKRIDSVQSAPRSFWDGFSLLGDKMRLGKNVSSTGLLGLYGFNKVTGHSLNYGLYLYRLDDDRFSTSGEMEYGFSDKRVKHKISAEYLLGDYRTYSISASEFSSLNVLFSQSDRYNELTTGLFALIGKNDPRSYYYSHGFTLGASGELTPVLRARGSFTNRTDKSAKNNTDFSFFNRDKQYDPNAPVNDVKLNLLKLELDLDMRDYIEDGYYRRRVDNTAFPLITVGVLKSDKKIMRSGMDFASYYGSVGGGLGTFRSASFAYRVSGSYSDEGMPTQLLQAVPGNLDGLGKNFTFRTVKLGEFFGDQTLFLNIEHDFRDELFRALHIPLLKD
ncbi:MAG TPA: DUF5686 family protein, partial [Ignavibacteriales bacterium]|nr:DUF5686 family protein [Ignavibacteriales bacterium]